MGDTNYREEKLAGPVGISMSAKPQIQSWLRPKLAWGDTAGRRVIAATIYFGTNEWHLTSDDRGVLRGLAKSLVLFLLLDGGAATVTCEGHADARGTEGHNYRLSGRRAQNASLDLQRYLGPSGFRIVPVGATGSKLDTAAWTFYRRVDVVVTITTGLEIEARNNPGNRARAEIFWKFHPSSYLWKGGLEYLVDEWVRHESDLVKIKPQDCSRVKLITVEIAGNKAEMAKLKTDAEILAAYNVEFESAWKLAYKRFQQAFDIYWDEHPSRYDSERIYQLVRDGEIHPVI